MLKTTKKKSLLYDDPAETQETRLKTTLEDDYIRRIFEPRTPEDLTLALQNTHTPAYKDMMKRLIAGAEIELVIMELIDRYLQHQYEADEKEREDFRAIMERESRRQEEFFKQMSPFQGKKLFENLQRYTADKISQLAIKCANTILDLQTKVEMVNFKLSSLEHDQLINLKKWEAGIQKKVAAVTQKLAAAKTPLFVRDAISREYRLVEVHSEQAQTILFNACSSPPPPRMIRELSTAFTGEMKSIPEHEAEREIADDRKMADEQKYQTPTVEDAITKIPQNQAIAAAFKVCMACINDERAQKEEGVEEINWGTILLNEIKGKNKVVIREVSIAEDEMAEPYREEFRIMKETDKYTKLKFNYQQHLDQETALLQRCTDRYYELTHKPLKIQDDSEVDALVQSMQAKK